MGELSLQDRENGLHGALEETQKFRPNVVRIKQALARLPLVNTPSSMKGETKGHSKRLQAHDTHSRITHAINKTTINVRQRGGEKIAREPGWRLTIRKEPALVKEPWQAQKRGERAPGGLHH